MAIVEDDASASASASFDKPKLNAEECKLSLSLPKFSFKIKFPTIHFPPDFLPKINFQLKLSCSLDNPVDVSAGIKFGGGREPNGDPSSDTQED